MQIISTSTSTAKTLTTKTTSDVIDLQDGHPNHRLWQKMIDSERASSHDWYVIYFDQVLSSFFFVVVVASFRFENVVL